jgi:hypothetical protein
MDRVPQDPAKQEQWFNDRFAWNQRTLLGAYEKVGKKDPRWDKPARATLEKAARHFSHWLEPRATLQEVFASAKEAIEAGCNDPLILYLYARSSYRPSYPDREELARRFSDAAAALERSDYPPFRRSVALEMAARLLSYKKNPTPADKTEVVRLYDASLALLPVSLKEDEPTPYLEDHWREAAWDVIYGLSGATGDSQAAFERTDAALAKTPEVRALRLQIRGEYFIGFAWRARGDGYADSVTEEGGRKFEERLAEARRALEESWNLQPHPKTARMMLAVETGSGGQRDQMEKWFTRAMQVGGDFRKVCEAKLNWLDPKWHGSEEEMMRFGRACRASRNWRDGITLIAAHAHFRLGHRRPDNEIPNYFTQPEVWKEIQEVYEEYLQHYPDDYEAHSAYAGFCCLCRQYREAHKHFQLAGDGLTGNVYYFSLDWLKKNRAAVAVHPDVLTPGKPLLEAKPPR